LTNRLDLGKGNNNRQMLSSYADFYTPEQGIGGYDDERPWETCMTLGRQWSWKPNDTIKSTSEVLAILARCVGGDGNLLLNVGPMPDGRIEPRQVEALKGVGAWMKQCGESIHGTRGGPYKPGAFGSSTRKGDTIYLHILKFTGDSVVLPALPKKVVKSSLLAGGAVSVEQTATDLRIVVAPQDRQGGDTVVKLQLDGSALDIAPLATPPEVRMSRPRKR
jgi:alpha-L-fucosidase